MPCWRLAVRHSTCGGSLLRRHGPLLACSPRRTTPSPQFALCASVRGAKSRSLSPDDPFGERSSWEDPSDGVYAAWKDVDLAGFAAAANSDEVRQAHFGPEWARFTTVGRLSVKKMHENRGRTTEDGAQTVETGTSAAERRSDAELAHERELRRKKELMTRNYTSYEAFLQAEYGDDANRGNDESMTPSSTDNPIPQHHAHETGTDIAAGAAAMYATAALESTFFDSVDGHDAHDRMVLRNPHHEALRQAEAAAEEEELPLPDFVCDAHSPLSAEKVKEAAVADSAPPTASASTAETITTVDETSPTRLVYTDASGASVEVPHSFVCQVMKHALGERHGNLSIPLVDPIEWRTEVIVTFLKQFEQRRRGQADAPSVMDESMREAFAMAQVDGHVLLDIVVPPRLFRVLRRWHTRRRDAVVSAHRSATGVSSSSNDSEHDAADDIWRTVAREWIPKLDEAVAPVDAVLIQETILLCFPYGGGGRG